MTTHTSTGTRTPAPREALLRCSLVGNALFSEITGIAFLAFSVPLARFLGIAPSWPLLVLGAGLLLFGMEVYWVSRRGPLHRRGVIAIIALDAAWVVASILLLIGDPLSLSSGGTWLLLLTADAVAAFGLLQYLGLRRAG